MRGVGPPPLGRRPVQSNPNPLRTSRARSSRGGGAAAAAGSGTRLGGDSNHGLARSAIEPLRSVALVVACRAMHAPHWYCAAERDIRRPRTDAGQAARQARAFSFF